MAKGVSSIVVSVLLLVISISVVSLFFMWSTNTLPELFEETEEDTQYLRSRACLNLDSINPGLGKLTITNCGLIPLTDFKLVIDGNYYNVSFPEKIDPKDSVFALFSPIFGEHDFIVTADFAETVSIRKGEELLYFTDDTTADFNSGFKNNVGTETENGPTASPGTLYLRNWRFLVDGNTVALWHMEEGNGLMVYNAEGDNTKNLYIYYMIYHVPWATDDFFEGDYVVNVSDTFGGMFSYSPEFSHLASGQGGTDAWSIEVWVKFDTVPSNLNHDSFLAGIVNMYELFVDTDDKIHMYWVDEMYQRRGEITSLTVVEEDTWYHILATWDLNSGTRLYVNGAPENSKTDSGTLAQIPRRYEMGGSVYGINVWMDGQIKEGRFSDKVREISESLFTKYRIFGTFESKIKDASKNVAWVELIWEEELNNGDIYFQFRSCDDSICFGEEFIGPDGTSETYYTNTIEALNRTANPSSRYAQYKVFFEGREITTPSLNKVSVGYIG